MTTTTTRIVLAQRPHGEPTDEDLPIETAQLPDPGQGQALLETLYLSLDPYMRGRMSDAESYVDPVALGDPMCGGTVSRVLECPGGEFAPGDVVLGYGGWQSHSLERTKGLTRLDPDGPPLSAALGVLGMPGFTAYSGLLTLGRPQPGETVVVAAASGPVGSAVGQIARAKGARAVGIAGGPEKCEIVRGFGFDAAVDHRADDFVEQLEKATPDGIDVYFENVGGKVFEAVLPRLNLFGRVPVCGLVSSYNATSLPEGPDRTPLLMNRILVKSLMIRGFIQHEFWSDQKDDFFRDMSGWVNDGTVRYEEDVVEGLENAPEAFRGLLVGRNRGKLVVHVAD